MGLKHILWGRGGEEQAKAYALTVYYSNLWDQVQHKQHWRTDHHFNHSQISAATVSSFCHWTFHYTDIKKARTHTQFRFRDFGVRCQQPTATAHKKKAFAFSHRGFLNSKNVLFLRQWQQNPTNSPPLTAQMCLLSIGLRVWTVHCNTRCILIGVHQVELQKVYLQSFF